MKATKSKGQLTLSVSSLKDAGYQSAISGERMDTVARFVFAECPGFTSDVPKEVLASLSEGWALRWQEINPAKKYTTDYVPSDAGTVEVSQAFCLSYSQQAFGQMKNEDPVKHSLIKGVRDAFSKYRSNRLSDLKTAVRRIEREGETKTKNPTKGYAEFITDTFTTMKARCKTASARGDIEANEVNLAVAIEAFKRAYNRAD
jgi:hypothetical protein